ncbi:MAG TPA: ATP-binding protein [Candidatus Binatia bacterium]|nr:ATP-binding protein [Candidatus Binatia bacterium]
MTGAALASLRALRSRGTPLSGSVNPVHRSLRFQLIAIVVVTVVTVLAGSQWLDTRLSERALERDVTERGRIYLRTIDSLWGRSDSETLAEELHALVDGDRDLTAIDVFGRRNEGFALDLTTRTGAGIPRGALRPEEERKLLSDGFVDVARSAPDGIVTWRMAVPLSRDGAVVGAAQVEFTLADIKRLENWFRVIDVTMLLASAIVISLLLAVFLGRRVARPVEVLVDGMRRAESGELGARVAVPGGGEFAFLGRSLNKMLTSVEDLTSGLESRVRQATHELAETNRELEAANEKLWRAQLEVGRSERLAALGQMAATIAHELGTPLNSVLGYTQLLLRDGLPAEHAGKLGVIESQVQRMIETIRSVLDRTRDRELSRTPVTIAPLVSEALALISTRLAGRALVLENEVPRELPAVPGDAAALRQVLINLLANAIDATEPPGTITVGAAVVTPNGRTARQLEIRVTDTGHGIPPEELRRVFEPFYTTKGPGRGTGLGLAIVDHIVRAHGGQVVIESAAGRGTTMRVRLPLET